MARRWLSVVALIALVVPVGGAANASPTGTGALGSHDFLLLSGSPDNHGDDSHWSWVATPPTDAPTVTTVSYFVDTSAHGGSAALTAAQIADIHAAAAVWNAAGANLNLILAASDATADIHVHMDTTSGCGGGTIGCAEFGFFGHGTSTYGDGHPQHPMASHSAFPGAQELTMYDDSTFGATWYSGAAGGIGGSELDFLTVVIQEFGHHLGLGHNDASAGHGEAALSPMNGLLSAGTVRRVLQPGDTAALTHLYGTAPEPSTFLLTTLGLLGLAMQRKGRPTL